MMRIKDSYAVLGVDCATGADDITRAYRRLARKYHPDVSEDPDGESKFKEVAEAYRTLKAQAAQSAQARVFSLGQLFDAMQLGYSASWTWLQCMCWWSAWGTSLSMEIWWPENRPGSAHS